MAIIRRDQNEPTTIYLHQGHGVRFGGQHLAGGQTHTVPRWMALELVGANRARIVENEAVTSAPESYDPEPVIAEAEPVRRRRTRTR